MVVHTIVALCFIKYRGLLKKYFIQCRGGLACPPETYHVCMINAFTH